ncbi:T9SS type A sorting domain-containing protein [Hallerella succinigenes]|uniref:Putative secreted protein (Por secretion system target) n=1 Tax=Hallerella succinigenes TaxID=1896222 RepID=A0A2M9A3C6_9BACT|nr:T9SS type A sorting domain-containing protein [Hallerella succinigenes]PJJ40127.1 putative secreted protein (Por secretion system target) [Hallerella succinigenes]
MLKKFAIFSSVAFGLATSAQALIISKSGGWFETVYAQWAPVSGATRYNVYCDGTLIDDALVRTYSSYVRADIPGVTAGSHTIQVAAVTSGSETESASVTATAIAHDRAGFAFNNGHVPGAYNTDGTLKSGAVVIYVSENTKNTVTLDVQTKSNGTTTTCKSFQGILNCMKKGYETRPIDFRFIGNVTDSDSLVAGDMVIDLGSSETSYLTIEGIGEDATANGWGIRLKNAQNVEIRNLGIMNVDSDEGDDIGLQQNNAYIWVHNVDFFYGDAGSDADQAKGDGSLDCKKSTYITFSYNHFWDNGKSNLLGLSEGTYSYNSTDYYITYHHNWYDHSDSRHPRVRYYNAHVYNNYYDGNAKYGAGSTEGSSIFMEGNYFRNCKYPMLTSMQGSDLYAGTSTASNDNATFSKEDGGTIKAYNNYMTGTYTFIPYGASSYVNKGSMETASSMGVATTTDFDAYVVANKSTTVPSSITSKQGGHYYSNFDTDSKMYAYTAESPENAKTTVESYAGRMNGGDFDWAFTDADDESYAVNTALKSALQSYTGSVKSIQGDGEVVITSSNSTGSSSSATSSSSSVSSSSSKTSSSSTVSSSSVATSGTITGDIVHNFTEDGVESDVFEIMGSLSTTKGSVTYDGETLTRCLKMESSTSITFTLSTSGTMRLVFLESFTGAVKVDDTKYTATAGIATVDLAAGSHTITKADVSFLFLIVIDLDENGSSSASTESSSSSASAESSSSSEESTAIQTQLANIPAGISFNRQTSHLTVGCAAVSRVEIFSISGEKVLHSANGTQVFNLDMLPSGIYLVRAKTAEGMQQMKFFKE